MILNDYIGEGGYAELPDSDDFYTEVCNSPKPRPYHMGGVSVNNPPRVNPK